MQGSGKAGKLVCRALVLGRWGRQEMGQEGVFLLPDVWSRFFLLEGPASEIA